MNTASLTNPASFPSIGSSTTWIYSPVSPAQICQQLCRRVEALQPMPLLNEFARTVEVAEQCQAGNVALHKAHCSGGGLFDYIDRIGQQELFACSHCLAQHNEKAAKLADDGDRTWRAGAQLLKSKSRIARLPTNAAFMKVSAALQNHRGQARTKRAATGKAILRGGGAAAKSKKNPPDA